MDGYGAARKKQFDFGKDTTVIFEKNGFGKTTLASFIKAMFYGLDAYRVNTVDFVDRKHFFPFDGGRFGGNIVFEKNGDTYKIERTFDEKSEKGDFVRVYKNENEFPFPADKIGEFFLGVDRAAFERTAFIGSEETEIKPNDSIKSKLGNFVSGTDENGVSAALKRLDDKAKKYKKRGNEGLIAEQKRKIDVLSQKEDGINRLREALSDRYSELEAINKEISAREKRLGELQKSEVRLKAWKTFRMLEESALSEKKTAESVGAKYNGILLPTPDDCRIAENTFSEYKALLSGKTVILTEEENLRFSELSKEFSDGVPTAEKLDEMQEKITSDALLSAELKEKKAKITEIPETALSEISSAKKEYETAKKEYENTAEYLSVGKKLPKTKFVIAAIISLVILLSGVFSFFFSVPVGVGLSIVGGVGILLTGFLYLSKKTDMSGSEIKNPEKEQKRKKLDDAEIKIGKILAVYGKSAERGVEYLTEAFLSEIEENERNKKAVAAAEKMLSKEKTAVFGFFEKYGITEDKPSLSMAKLRSDVAEYGALSKAKEGNERRDISLRADISAKKEFLLSFCRKYGLDFENAETSLPDFRKDCEKFANALKTAEEQAEKAEEYRKAENLTETEPVFSEEEKTSVETTLSELRKNRSSLESTVAGAETYLEENDGITAEKEAAEETLEKYCREFSLIETTAKMLIKADKALKNRYILPVKNNFTEYSGIFREVVGENIMISEDFDISFEKEGLMRSEKYLSSGEKSLCAFCFRMALIDNMYPDEKPFIILDDPFVALDGTRFERVKKLLNKLSETFQIIYLTCHESRKL